MANATLTTSRKTSLMSAMLALTACGGGNPAPGFAPALPPPPQAKPSADGAIFSASFGYAALHEGTRARSVGDALTILLVEDISSSKTTKAQTNRSGGASISPPTAGPLSFLNPDALKAGADSSFSGRGNVAQSSTLGGTVAVTIAEVRPNGTALVIGEKLMELSQGREWIQFSGIVRLADVDVDNRVLSSQVANARISYSGNGAIQQASKPGWLSTFFNTISPF